MKNKDLGWVVGMPTAPDVKRLHEAIGVPKEGELVTYERIEQAIGESRKNARWRTVVGVWRRQLFNESNILLIAVANKGFLVADEKERVHCASGSMKGGLRKVWRASNIAQTTSDTKLDEEEKRVRLHMIHTAGLLRLTVAAEAKRLRWGNQHDPGELDKKTKTPPTKADGEADGTKEQK